MSTHTRSGWSWASLTVPTGETNWPTEADERIRAAAPDLLEALEVMTRNYVELAGSGDCGNWNPEEDDFVISARAAIAKARGETT